MGWKVTATKLFCDTMKEWATIMVYHDGTTKCGYHERHPAKDGSDDKGKGCADHCTLLAAYKEDVFQREKIAD